MSRPGPKPTGPLELMARVRWLEAELAELPEAEADPVNDPNGWEAEKRAFLDGVEMIRLLLWKLTPRGKFGSIGDAETLTMMGIKVQSRIGRSDLMRRWIAKARAAALDPKRQAA